MLIPRYWARQEAIIRSPDGFEYDLRTWGCSAVSEADAQSDAQRRWDALAARIRGGRHPDHTYVYGTSLMREALLHELPGPDGQPAAIITRNRYGSLVLNAQHALFLDIDLPHDSLLRRLGRLMRGSNRSLEEQVLEDLRNVLATHSEGYRVYRTAAGFRLLCTSRLHEPGSQESELLMRRVHADKAFILLCRVQKCFRARLSPKPWRIGQPIPRLLYPFETPEVEAAFEDWRREYDEACNGWATCRLVEQLGPASPHEQIQPVMQLHDIATRCTSDLPLA